MNFVSFVFGIVLEMIRLLGEFERVYFTAYFSSSDRNCGGGLQILKAFKQKPIEP